MNYLNFLKYIELPGDRVILDTYYDDDRIYLVIYYTKSRNLDHIQWNHLDLAFNKQLISSITEALESKLESMKNFNNLIDELGHQDTKDISIIEDLVVLELYNSLNKPGATIKEKIKKIKALL